MPTNLADLDGLVRTLTGAYRTQMERFSGQVAFARKLTELHPNERAQWDALIEEAIEHMRSELEAGRLESLQSAIEEAERIMAPIGEVAKQYTIHCVGHAHIDMNWMWSWPETVSATNDTFTTVFRLMDAYPDFCYIQSQ